MSLCKYVNRQIVWNEYRNKSRNKLGIKWREMEEEEGCKKNRKNNIKGEGEALVAES